MAYPSGPERTEMNEEFKKLLKLMNKDSAIPDDDPRIIRVSDLPSDPTETDWTYMKGRISQYFF